MSPPRRRRRLHRSARFTPASSIGAALVVASLLLGSRPAHAAPGDEAAAEALFVEAKKLAAEGKFAQACPKFAESNRLDRGAGTLIHLADCYEKNNQSASAWATFKDAASAAQALGRADWQKLASTRAAALEPKLAKLSIKVQEPADKIEVTRDGSGMSQASWSTPIPIDVGQHTIAATAPGRKPFKATVMVGSDGERKEVVIPRLELASSGDTGGGTPPVPPPPPVDHRDGSSQKTIGYIVGGVGIAGVAVGAITGLVAIGKNSDSKKACPDDGACSDNDAVQANKDAGTFGTVSTIAFIAGGVGIAAGAVLILTAPPSGRSGAAGATRSTAKGLRIVPATDGRSGGLFVSGLF